MDRLSKEHAKEVLKETIAELNKKYPSWAQIQLNCLYLSALALFKDSEITAKTTNKSCY